MYLLGVVPYVHEYLDVRDKIHFPVMNLASVRMMLAQVSGEGPGRGLTIFGRFEALNALKIAQIDGKCGVRAVFFFIHKTTY